MTENPSPPNQIDFSALIDQLSEKLAFGDREKLGAFIRGMVAVVLDAMEAKTKKKFSADQVQFCLAKTNRNLDVAVKLDIIEKGGGAISPRGICSVSIKESNYQGLPDGVKMGKDPTKAVPMVRRKRISAMEFRPKNDAYWHKVAQILKINNRPGADTLQLDIQI